MGEKLSSKIYKNLQKDIWDGVYTPRDFISEAQIAEKYGVSKAPVKEALHILSNQGYLVRYPRRGYMVNSYSDEEINQIQEVRRKLEALSIELTIKNASDEEIEALRFYSEDEVSADDPKDTINYRFHVGLAKLSGNEILVDTVSPLIAKASMSQIRRIPDTKNFDKIIDALLDRNLKQSLKYLEEDIRFLNE